MGINWQGHCRSVRLMDHLEKAVDIRRALFSDSRSEAQAEGRDVRTSKVGPAYYHEKLADMVFLQDDDSKSEAYRLDKSPFSKSLGAYLAGLVPHFFLLPLFKTISG